MTDAKPFICLYLVLACFTPAPLTSTWPHLRCDVGLEQGNIENCLCVTVLCAQCYTKVRAVLTGWSTVSGFVRASFSSSEHLCVCGLHGAVYIYIYIYI